MWLSRIAFVAKRKWGDVPFYLMSKLQGNSSLSWGNSHQRQHQVFVVATPFFINGGVIAKVASK
jgi:hypothetical protein